MKILPIARQGLFRNVLVLLAVLLTNACGGGGGGDDNTPPPKSPPPPTNESPTVGISNLTQGQVISGPFKVEITASDDGSVARVELIEERFNTTFATDTSDPFEGMIEPGEYFPEDGPVDIVATATDNTDKTTSTKVSVIIDFIVPVVDITSHDGSVSLSGVETLAVSATDIVQGELVLSDDTVLCTLGPQTLSCDWDTTSVTDGSYTVIARITDAAGNTAEDSVTVQVQNAAAVENLVGRNRLSTIAVYPDELQTKTVVWSMEMTLCDKCTAYAEYNRNIFVGSTDNIRVPFEDPDGDGNWEARIQLNFPEATAPALRDGSTDHFFLRAKFFAEDGSQMFPEGGRPESRIGVVSRSVEAAVGVRATSSPNIVNTENGIIGVRADDFDGSFEDVDRISRLLYSVYPDDRWDGVFFVNFGWSYADVPFHPESFDPGLYGSAGNLKTIAWMDNRFDFGAAMHEFWHFLFFKFTNPSLPLNVGAEGTGHVGFCNFKGLFASYDLVDNGDGTSTLASQSDPRAAERLSELSAYWAGMLPSFSPFRCLTDTSVNAVIGTIVSNSSITEVDMEAFRNVYGETPTPFATSQKNYNGAMVAILQDRNLEPAEIDYLTAIARSYASTANSYTINKGTTLERVSPGSFYHATHGNGRMYFPTDE